MRILIASTAFPESAAVLRERLPCDEVIVDAGDADGRFDVIVPLMRRVGAEVMDRYRPVAGASRPASSSPARGSSCSGSVSSAPLWSHDCADLERG